MSAERPERIGANEAAAICGYHPKTMRKLARKGIIPGAAVIGNCWRFDERRLRDWIRRQEAATCREGETTSISGVAPGMRGSKFAAGTCDEAYERLLRSRPGGA